MARHADSCEAMLGFRMNRQSLEAAVKSFNGTHIMHVHNQLPSLDPLPEFKLKKCFYACRCLCTGRDNVLLNGLEDRFVAFVQAYCPKPKNKRDATPLRVALKFGSLVARLFYDGEGDDGTSATWLHIAHVNLQSWEMSLADLTLSTDPAHVARVGDDVALQVPLDCSWQSSWDKMAKLNVHRTLWGDLYSLVGNVAISTGVLQPNYLQARRMTDESSLVWAGFGASTFDCVLAATAAIETFVYS